MLYGLVTLSGNACQLQPPSPALFVPVKAAVTPPAGQNKPLPGEDVEVAKVASFQTTPMNLNSKAAKGMYSSVQG